MFWFRGAEKNQKCFFAMYSCGVAGRRGGGASASQDGHPRADVFTWSAAMTACIEGGEWARVDGMLDVSKDVGL